MSLKKIYIDQIILGDKKTFLSFLLLPLSFTYYLVLRLMGFFMWMNLIPENQLPAKVVCVGNITTGGTGKTPITMKFLDWFLSRDLNVGVLTRGYGLDELQLYQESYPSIPVIVGKNRYQAAMAFIKKNVLHEVFIMDDGFQHHALAKNVSVVLVNACNPFGNGFLLPAGPLREPFSAIDRADAVILTNINFAKKEKITELKKVLKILNNNLLIAASSVVPYEFICPKENERLLVEKFNKRTIIAFCAIGNPKGFKLSLESMGFKIFTFYTFQDHQKIPEEDVIDILEVAKREGYPVIATEKDFARDRALFEKYSLWYLKIKVKFTENEKELYELVVG